MVNYQVQFVLIEDDSTYISVHVVITEEMNVECPSDVIDRAEVILATIVKDAAKWIYSDMQGE